MNRPDHPSPEPTTPTTSKATYFPADDSAASDGPAETRDTPPRHRHRPAPTPATTVDEAPAPSASGGGDAESVLRLYTPARAAELLAVRESWLRRRAGRRQVPCTFLGKHLRFSAADLRAITAQGARGVRAPHHRTTR